MSDLYVDRAEAASLLRSSTDTVDRLRKSGELLAKKLGSRVLIPRSEIDRLLDELPTEERK